MWVLSEAALLSCHLGVNIWVANHRCHLSQWGWDPPQCLQCRIWRPCSRPTSLCCSLRWQRSRHIPHQGAQCHNHDISVNSAALTPWMKGQKRYSVRSKLLRAAQRPSKDWNCDEHSKTVTSHVVPFLCVLKRWVFGALSVLLHSLYSLLRCLQHVLRSKL